MPDEIEFSWKDGHYRVSDGTKLFYRHWEPADSPKGYVVALHGIQSHSGWYKHSSRRLCRAGYDVRFLDRRGSGENGAPRGHAVHADRLIHDVREMLCDVCRLRDRQSESVPVVLLGVSWGGKLATAVAGRRPELLDGLALLYPGICTRFQPGWHQKFLVRTAHVFGAGRKRIRLPLDDPALFTGDPAWQEYIRTDPLAIHEASVDFLNVSLMLDEDVQDSPRRIAVPTLVMLAGRDEIVDNEATKGYLKRFASPDVTVREYPSARHTLEFEPERDAIFNDLIDWLGRLSRTE